MPKVIRIVYGQVVEADSQEELERKVEELKARYQVAVPQNPFHAPTAYRPSAVRVDETKAVDRPKDSEEEVFDIDDASKAYLPEELGLTGLPDVIEEEPVEEADSPVGEADGPITEAEEEATPEEVEGGSEEDVVEIPENFEELPRQELVAIAAALGLDTKGNRKTLLKRIKRAIEEEAEDEPA